MVEGKQDAGGTFSRVVELSGSTSRFDVETPTAVASVRGTVFFSLSREDATTLWGVLEGILRVDSEGEQAELDAGFGVTVGRDGGLGMPFVLTSAQLAIDFLQFNLCTLDETDDCVKILAGTTEPKEKEPKPDHEAEPEPTPEPVPQTVTSSGPEQEEQVEREKPKPPPPLPPPPPQPVVEQEPPAPPPPAPEPEPPAGGPPCLNPGNDRPCDTPAGPGGPPGQGGTPPGQAGGNGNGNGKN
jgi:hypothetical protein